MESASLVTPSRSRRNWCQERSETGSCLCHEAEHSQLCQSCHKRIVVGDCIGHNGIGWGHAECPVRGGEDARGVPSIEAGYSDNVDYGSAYRRRIESDGRERRLLMAPRRLEFDESREGGGEEGDDAKATASGSKRPTAGEGDASGSNACEGSNERDAKRLKCAHGGSESSGELDEDKSSDGLYDEIVPCDDDSDGEGEGAYADQKKTNEQMAILSHMPQLGDVVVVNALAGCGKTTTIALLCDQFHNAEPRNTILYLVFNKSVGDEAMQSNKFPKDNMEIRTTHSYVLRHYFGVGTMQKVKPEGSYKLDDIIDELGLRRECRQMNVFKTLLGSRKGEQQLEKRITTIAGLIRKTLNKFQASADRAVDKGHVPPNHQPTKRTPWKEGIGAETYVGWAQQIFDTVHKKCIFIRSGHTGGSDIAITHDGYLKVAQLESLNIPHDLVFIDEAQDMSACQAELLWGAHQRAGKITYMFGDKYQQIYGFRGASESFRDMVARSHPKFTLSGSFRFGKEIAKCATCVLQALDGETLDGRSKDRGVVERVEYGRNLPTLSHCVVLSRTQNGIYKFLYRNKPARWCFNTGGPKAIPLPKERELDLEAFLRGQEKGDKDDDNEDGSEHADKNQEGDSNDEDDGISNSFAYKGEVFNTCDEIREYIDEEDDIELGKALTLLQYLVREGTGIVDFYRDLQSSFCPMQDNETPENYDGVVLTTVHKAKGLEFSRPVLINDDFNFKAISTSAINRGRRGDEANILYVAITRAKKVLRLSPAVEECLQKLARLDHVKMQLPSMVNIDSSRKKFADWKEKWAAFKDSSDAIESVGDVPYPPQWNDDNFPFALHSAMSVPEQKKHLWCVLRTCHPDKFFPTFGKRIQCRLAEASIKTILDHISRKCKDLLDALRNEDED